MKICIDLTSLAFNFSGIERYAMCISKELIKNKDNDFILLFCNEVHPAYSELVKEKNISTKLLKAKNTKLAKFRLFQISNLFALYNIKANVYVFLAFEPPVLFRHKNIITTIHDLGFFEFPHMWHWYISLYGRIKMRAALKHSRNIIAVSRFTKSRLIKNFKYPANKIHVVYNAVDERFIPGNISESRQIELKKKYNLSDQKFILCLGTIEPRKNIELLIDAYGELRDTNQIEKSLVVVGRKGWKVDQLLKRLSEQARDDIRLTGFVDDYDLPDIYKLADFFVFPSLYEGFGIPPLEAISCGTQTIVSDISVFKEVLGQAVQYFKSNNKNDLKHVLLSDKKIDLEEMSKQSARFSWKKSGDKYYEYILNIE